MDIYLKKAVLHVADPINGDPLCSTAPLDLTKEYVRDFLQTKIKKISSAKAKTGYLDETEAVSNCFRQLEETFVTASSELLELWYRVYHESEEAPGCDVLIVLYELDTILHAAFLKINYQNAYTHFADVGENGLENQLILNQAILGNKAQKSDEGVLVNLSSLSFELVEKRYLFSGEKRYYFSESFLKALPAPSFDESVNIIKKTAKKVSSQFPGEDFQILANVTEAIFDSVDETGAIDEIEVAEHVFKDNYTAKAQFQEALKESSFSSEAPVVNELQEISAKKLGKQKFKMSNGIELIVPVDVYRNPDLIEFVNNPDGTISVMIKNVDEVINRL